MDYIAPLIFFSLSLILGMLAVIVLKYPSQYVEYHTDYKEGWEWMAKIMALLVLIMSILLFIFAIIWIV